jgi:hypothetical protein
MSPPPKGSSTRLHTGKPPAPPESGAGRPSPEDPKPPASPTYPGFQVALTLWMVAFAVLVLYEVSFFVMKLTF